MERIRANALMFAIDYEVAMLKGLKESRTVTQFVSEPRGAEGDGLKIEFDLVVTRINGKRVPRISKARRSS